jgi:hypothetical protein
MKRLALIATTLTMVLAPAAALAGSYEALCGGTKCTIQVTPRGIDSPQGSIPASRVSYWSVNGESSTSVGTGVATTILFGGIGLLGFLAKNHEFDFTVDGYDAEGRRVAMQFKFKNDKPAKKLTSELYRVSGLAMGRQRSIAEIQAIESGEAPLNAMEGTVEPTLADTKKQKKLDCGRVLQDYDCNYEKYLAANPTVKAWAENNPELAAKERIRLGAFTQDEIKEQEERKPNSLQRLQPSLGSLEGYTPDPLIDRKPATNTEDGSNSGETTDDPVRMLTIPSQDEATGR